MSRRCRRWPARDHGRCRQWPAPALQPEHDAASCVFLLLCGNVQDTVRLKVKGFAPAGLAMRSDSAREFRDVAVERNSR
jgi:hypothetical protein